MDRHTSVRGSEYILHRPQELACSHFLGSSSPRLVAAQAMPPKCYLPSSLLFQGSVKKSQIFPEDHSTGLAAPSLVPGA